MDNASRPSLHPVIWIASVAVILFAGVGTAHFLGLLPKNETPAAPPVATDTAPAAAPASAASAPPAAAPVSAAAQPATAPSPQKTVRKPVAAKPAVQASTSQALGAAPAATATATCRDCGTIESVRQVTKEGEGSGLGAVAGGVLGGALGHNVGQGRGRDLATVAGVVGGAVLGNKMEKSQKSTTSWEITVRLDDGTSQLLTSATQPAWRAGDKVKIVSGAIVSR